ncbi:MAG: hypothetical protein LPK07_03460 [Hymenobacteraceae bacterium]|nr:hypothetical protein [Hymenobacteraceae bacterium]
MRKTIYTIALFLSLAAAAQAQTPIKETREEVADVTLFNEDLLLYTRKEGEGQFIYTEQRREASESRKDPVLNAGAVNTIIGRNAAAGELFVYHRLSRKEEKIAVYTFTNGAFTKTAERPLPKMMNHSYNLGLFLTEDKSQLLISAELGKTRGYDDIYLSKWENNRWSRPKNLGKKVNTRQPEFAPFVANDSLYFARKTGSEAYIFAVPFGGGTATVAAEPARLDEQINKESAFNAYYKKLDEREVWITAAADAAPEERTLTAFVSEAPVVATEPAPVAAAAPEAAPAPVKAAEETPAEVVAVPALSLPYGFNEVFLSEADLVSLIRFLDKQPKGAGIRVKGYSDATGTEAVKQRTGHKRALYVQWFIQKYYAGKSFKTSIEHEVTAAAGSEGRKADLFVSQQQ